MLFLSLVINVIVFYERVEVLYCTVDILCTEFMGKIWE